MPFSRAQMGKFLLSVVEVAEVEDWKTVSRRLLECLWHLWHLKLEAISLVAKAHRTTKFGAKAQCPCI